MKNPLAPLVFVAAVLMAPGGDAAAQSLARRHQIELRLGGWKQVAGSRTEVSVGGVRTTVDSGGMAGGIAYGRWLTEGMQLQIGADFLGADVFTSAGVSGVVTSTAVVTALFVETKWYFPGSTFGEPVRPFARVGAGTFIGTQTSTEAGTVTAVESRTEAVPGGRIGVGVDFPVGRRFLLSVGTAYNLMPDLDRPIGGSRNFSGPEGTIGFSLLLGRGV
jgi:hypothetical protein